ncbi:MAG: PAS domain-containing protein [Proteobacteria bacterium]|nr:PAS domain-containing protein [Pseudomonadota bacterium]
MISFFEEKVPPIVNIGLVGGGDLCLELLKKTAFDYYHEEVYAPILAVADSDPASPGMVLARERGLLTFTDYHELYDRRYNIHLIIVLTPDEQIFEEILKTRPLYIRIMAYHVFIVFLEALKVKERKLTKRNVEVETILHGIQDFITVITPDLDIVEVNEAFYTKMGYSREDVVGRKCYEIFQHSNQPCSDEELVCPLKEVIRNKRPCRQIRTRVRSDEERRHIEVNVYPIWEKDGRIAKFIHISRDITQQIKEDAEITRRLEQMVNERTRQLKETHDKLLHQDKMASLGKLAASVVHEINNPIAGILTLTMLIKRIIAEEAIKEKELDQFRRYLDLMETETRRISRIVNNMLAFSRNSKMEFKSVNINRLIETTLFLTANLLKINGVKVEKKLSSNLPDLVGSEDQLQQVFMNIVSNAAESIESDQGGVLRIETRHFKKSDKIAIRFHNTGSMIPQENISKIFEPFFSTKTKGKGAGLGLSVAYGIIKEHNGTIFVESEKDKGTSFTVKLPLSQPAGTPDQDGGPDGQHENFNRR